jgi:hypothetical protein
MGLTLNQNGYAWDFESALKDPAQPTGPATHSDKGVGACHGSRWWRMKTAKSSVMSCYPRCRPHSRQWRLLPCRSFPQDSGALLDQA